MAVMSGQFWIDGYNLIHAIGLLPRKVGPGGLEKARLALLGLVKGALGESASCVTVVFDALRAPPGVKPEQNFHGIHVRYAVDKQQADDVIEDLLQHAPVPKSVTVVSDDHRLQQAARRRRAKYLGCQAFLDLLEKSRSRKLPNKKQPERQHEPSAEETKEWLSAFGDLEKDPEFKELFERFGM
jgi:predicted RNA-binding protein with PIN domain